MTVTRQRAGSKPSGSRAPYYALVGAAREQTARAATRVSAGKEPVKAVSRLALGLTALSHRTADKVLRQQQNLLEHQIDGLAARLRTAAASADMRALVGSQATLLRQDASRFALDAREALAIVAGAGRDAGTLLRGTFAELRGRPAAGPARKKAVRKTAQQRAARPSKTKGGRRSRTRSPAGV